MKRSALAITLAATSAAILPSLVALAAGPFETKLPADRQIVHVLNRLTFGPRPGDVDEVKRVGLEKWIDLQLHPERIQKNPDLESRLEPYETLRMDAVAVVTDYMQQQQMMMVGRPVTLNTLLTQDEMRKILNGTAEERKAALTALDPEKRKQVLPMLPPTNLASIPEFQKEADDARKAQMEERQAANRKMNPTLNDLLTFDQIKIAMRGEPVQLKELFSDLPPENRAQVAAALPFQISLRSFPTFAARECAGVSPNKWSGPTFGRGSFFAPCIPIANWRKCSSISGSITSMCTKTRTYSWPISPTGRC